MDTERRSDSAPLNELLPSLTAPTCEARRPESVELHLQPDGSTPPAAAALTWRHTMSCCGHPIVDAGAMQLLCATCLAFVFAATYSCRGCRSIDREPVGWWLASVVQL